MFPPEHRKKEKIMAALATPKKSSYILKKDCSAKIIESKNSAAVNKRLMERAAVFEMNNLKRAKD